MSISEKNSKNTVQSTLQNKNWCSAVQCSESETAKRCVFSRLLKMPSVSDAVTLDGKLFQIAEQRQRRSGHQSTTSDVINWGWTEVDLLPDKEAFNEAF